ncbi:MAG: hypothetical protein V7K67_04405, partial [Nostoc sp.]|uniref:hypothetical protein n=1 Tax=Nostoc sp. TaxID=1180 RepID=UPI002FFD1C31
HSTFNFTLCANLVAPNPCNYVVQISSYVQTHRQERLRDFVDELIKDVDICQYKYMFVYIIGDLGHTL